MAQGAGGAKRLNQVAAVCALGGAMVGWKVAQAICQRYDPTVGFSVIELAASGLGGGIGAVLGGGLGSLLSWLFGWPQGDEPLVPLVRADGETPPTARRVR